MPIPVPAAAQPGLVGAAAPVVGMARRVPSAAAKSHSVAKRAAVVVHVGQCVVVQAAKLVRAVALRMLGRAAAKRHVMALARAVALPVLGVRVAKRVVRAAALRVVRVVHQLPVYVRAADEALRRARWGRHHAAVSQKVLHYLPQINHLRLRR